MNKRLQISFYSWLFNELHIRRRLFAPRSSKWKSKCFGITRRAVRGYCVTSLKDTYRCRTIWTRQNDLLKHTVGMSSYYLSFLPFDMLSAELSVGFLWSTYLLLLFAKFLFNSMYQSIIFLPKPFIPLTHTCIFSALVLNKESNYQSFARQLKWQDYKNIRFTWKTLLI